MSTLTSHPIKYIGNNWEGNEPFGVFCDFRIYLFLISNEKIELLANQESGTVFFWDYCLIYKYIGVSHPDYIHDIMLKETRAIVDLLKVLDTNTFNETLIEACRALANLATKRWLLYCLKFYLTLDNCRIGILKEKGFEKLIFSYW